MTENEARLYLMDHLDDMAYKTPEEYIEEIYGVPSTPELIVQAAETMIAYPADEYGNCEGGSPECDDCESRCGNQYYPDQEADEALERAAERYYR